MTTIQEIRALELKIYEAAEEYLNAPDDYNNPVLHVWLDPDEPAPQAEVASNLTGDENEGIYPIASILREGDDGQEPDIDRISEIANSWLFLD